MEKDIKLATKRFLAESLASRMLRVSSLKRAYGDRMSPSITAETVQIEREIAGIEILILTLND